MTTTKTIKRPGSGRKKGTLNKVTASVRQQAQKFTSEAVDVLTGVMRNSIDDRCRLAAATALLDRGHGRPPAEMPQPIAIAKSDSLTDQARSVIAAIAAGTLAPGDGARLVAALGSLGKLIDLDEIAERIKALETHYANK